MTIVDEIMRGTFYMYIEMADCRKSASYTLKKLVFFMNLNYRPMWHNHSVEYLGILHREYDLFTNSN